MKHISGTFLCSVHIATGSSKREEIFLFKILVFSNVWYYKRWYWKNVERSNWSFNSSISWWWVYKRKSGRRVNIEKNRLVRNSNKDISRCKIHINANCRLTFDFFDSLLLFTCRSETEKTETEKRGDELYRTAMRFLDKGRAASSEAKKAAYRLLDEAAQLKHKEAMKLTGALCVLYVNLYYFPWIIAPS